MIAFWKYDLFPYCLAGTFVKSTENGFVQVREYGTALFKPIIVLPDDKGLEIKEQLEGLRTEYEQKLYELREEYTQKAKEVANFL